MDLLKKLLRHQLPLVLLLVMGLWLSVQSAQAAINDQIHFQGKVVNSDGTNVTNGTYSFTFTIYDASTVGTNLWTETKDITVTDGIFATDLGSVTDLPSSINFNSDSLYLGVNFNGDGEMSPRIRLTAVPYAFNAEKVAGLTVTETTGTLTIPAATIAFSGDNDVTLTSTGATVLTLPTTGTLATLAGTETFANKTIASSGLTIESTGWIGLGSGAGRITFTDAATDIIAVQSANLGIGSTSPTTLLNVVGSGANIPVFATSSNISTSFASIMELGYNTSSTIGKIGHKTINSVETFYLIGSAARQIAFGAASSVTPHLLINTSGNVGIGTISPDSFLLEVAGNIGPEANNTRSLGSDTKRWASIHTTQVCLSGDCQTAWPEGGAGVFTKTGTNLSPTTAGDDIYLATNELLGVGYDPSTLTGAVAAFNGNVGIGTSTANGRLHVYHSLNSYASFVLDNPNTGAAASTSFAIGESPLDDPWRGMFFEYYNSGFSSSGLRVANSAAMMAGAGATGGFSVGVDNTSGPLRFFTNGISGGDTNVRMLIEPGGNIGVGTTTPLAKLHVAGDILLDNGEALQARAPNGSARDMLWMGTGTNGQTKLRMFRNANTFSYADWYWDTVNNRYIIADTLGGDRYGGILMSPTLGTTLAVTEATSGTTTKDYTLTLQGEYWNGAATVSRQATIVHNLTATTPASQLDFAIAGSTLVSLLDTGNFGIGSTNPGRLLDVAGAMRLNSTAEPTSPALGDVYTNADGNLYFYNGSGWDDLTAAGTGTNYWAKTGTNVTMATAGDDLYLGSGELLGIGYDPSVLSNAVAAFNGNIGIGTSTVASDYLVDILGNSTTDYSRLLNLTQNNNALENTFGMVLTSNPAKTVADTGFTDTGLYIAMAPTVNIEGDSSTEYNVRGTNTNIDLTNVDITTFLAESYFNVDGSKTSVTGDLYINTSTLGGGVFMYINGTNSEVSVSPSINAIDQFSGLEVSGGLFTVNGSSFGNADLSSSAFAVKGIANSQLNSDGNSSQYGGYFTASLSNDTNYGIYTSAIEGTVNYGIYSAAGLNYFSGNTGIGTTTIPRKLTVAGAMRLNSTAEPTSPALGDVYTNADGNLYFYNGSGWDDLTAAGTGTNYWAKTGTNVTMATAGDDLYLGSGELLGVGYDPTAISGGVAAFNGNVGIGTTAPAATLHISDATSPAIAIVDTTNTVSTVLQSIDSSGLVGTSSNHTFAIITNSQTRMAFDSTGNTGIGTTSSIDSKLEVYSSNTTRALQIIGDSVTTGEVIDISADGLTTGYAMNMSSTSNNLSSGGLIDLDWTPSAVATASGDLFKINLGAHADLTGNIFALYDSGNSIFLASTVKITSAVPHEFTASGDVSIAYDIVLTNQTASEIQSYGPLTIKSGEAFENLDLTLDPSGSGGVVIADGSNIELYADQQLIFDVDDGSNSYIQFDNTNNRVEVFSDGSERFRFTASGNNESNGTLTTTLSDLAENYPTMNDTLEAGDVVMITESSESAPAASLVDTATADKTQNVLGVVSSKPGIVLGGSSFLSDICEETTASASGEVNQKLKLLQTEYKQLKMTEIEALQRTASSSSSLLEKAEEQLAAELAAMTFTNLEEALPATTIKTVEDRLSSCSAVKQVPVALAGRVPVKFDDSQGGVRPGDLLTISSTKPGTVTKASTVGWVIGRALAASSPDSETVMMFVNISWYGGSSYSSLGQVLGTSDLKLNTNVGDALSLKNINGKQFLVSSTNMNVFGTLTAETISATDRVLTGALSIGGITNEITTFNGSILRLQNAFGAGNIEIFNKKVVIGADGSLISEDQITAKRFAGSDDSRGSVFATSSKIRVDRQWKSAPASITLTPEYRADVWVSDITKDGFYINAEPLSSGKKIFWWAVW